MDYDLSKMRYFEVVGHDHEIIGHEIRDQDDKFVDFIPFVPEPGEWLPRAPQGDQPENDAEGSVL